MLSRRQFCKLGLATVASATAMASRPLSPPASANDTIRLPIVRNYQRPDELPNVLFIGIDDLNDWIGPLGGHLGVKSPNIDRLAQRGVVFDRAYCAYPLCNPSRTALMTGVAPSTSGIYTNAAYFRTSPALTHAVTIPQHFMNHGYRVTGAGKMNCSFPDPPSWESYWPSIWPEHPLPLRPSSEEFPLNGLPVSDEFFDWGPLDGRTKEEMSDWQIASHVAELLGASYARPFFIACGFTSPHLPFYAPQEYFDRHPLEQISLPPTQANDLDDVPNLARALAWSHGDHQLVLQAGLEAWRDAVRSYLACISLMDDCVGRVLDALDNSAHRDNTLIVLWSDHGLHLGEKEHWRKYALWEETTRNILLFAGHGVNAPGQRVRTPVSLLDIYPTMIDLCGLEPKPGLEGESLAPFFVDANYRRTSPAVTALRGPAGVNFSIRSRQWRYTRYTDGGDELYDHRVDRNEWNNLAGDPAYASIVSELAQWIPRHPAPIVRPAEGAPSGVED